MNTQRGNNSFNSSVTRRTFLKVSGALASGAAVISPVFTQSKAVAATSIPTPGAEVITAENLPNVIETAEDIMYTVCQMCHSRCGLRAKVQEGILVKLDGNPYHPNNRDVDENLQPDRLPYNTAPTVAWQELGRVCLKGQAGLQTVYDPYRVQHPLKRVGARNSGQWETISWSEAFTQIAAEINSLIPPGERDQLIDPAIPELGKKRNQLGFAPGRSVEKEMSERIWKNAWGTANYGLSHTSICESSRHVANELITWDPAGTKTSMGAGRSEGWQADILGAEYIIFFGANPLEADFPMVGMARNLMEFKRNGGEYVCVDPRLNNTGAKANQWVPIIPGTDAALAMGMIRWIIENYRHDTDYLRNTHKAAADANGEPTWSDSTYLVGTLTDAGGEQFQRYITAKEAGIADGTAGSAASSMIDFNTYVPASYGGRQDSASRGTVTVEPDGSTLHLVGNRWQQIGLPYDVTPDTVLEFDFQSDAEGEIHGIGFDDDLTISADRTFRVYGTQGWGRSDYADYPGDGSTKHYVIPAGQFYTGAMQYLFFVMDHDVPGAIGQSRFSNVRVYEMSEADDDYVVSSDGALVGYNAVEKGDLEFDQIVDLTIDGIPQSVEVKSAFTLLKESAMSMSLDQYAAICDVSAFDIEGLADEFVSHGKKAAAITYRGPIKHTNGLYNQLAIQHLNTLIGNYDWKGGCTAGAGGWNHKSGVVNLGKVAGDPGHEGIRIDRAKTQYNATEAPNLFTNGYPAARPWFPLATHGNYQEVIPSIQDEYPYALKALITFWNAWPYSTPALRKTWEDTVSDESKLPLLVSITPVIGEVAAWADYILPDTVYLEKFSVPGIPWRVNKGTAFQRPVVGKFDGHAIGDSGGVGNTIPVNGTNDYEPVLPDTKAVLDIHIGLAKALGLPGVGVDALLDDNGDPVGNLDNSWDWARAILQNIANSTGAGVHEIVSKGGVFDNPTDEYTGDQLTYQYGNIIRTFMDPLARTRDSVTGEYYSGVPHYKPIVHSNGVAVNDSGFPYRLITYKTVHHGQARTNVNPWLMLMIPENPVEISAIDAATMGVETGDKVTIKSASNTDGITGKALVTQRLKPGVIAISHHYGHWEQHSRDHVVTGGVDQGSMGHDPSRGAGLQPNEIMRTDDLYTNISLQEPIGASCSFYDTSVQVTKLEEVN